MSEVTTAKIFAQVNGGAFSADGLRFEMDVNSFPMVSASMVDTSAGAVQTPVSGDVIKRIGELQQQRLAGRSAPDFSVDAQDGIGGSISYEGYTSSPILDITKVSSTDKIASVGQAAMMDALDLSIYRAGFVSERAETGAQEGQLKSIPAAANGDINKVLEDITTALVENFEPTLAGESRAIAKQLLVIQHEINTGGPLDDWLSLLRASDVKFKSWDAAFAKCPPIARQLTEHARQALVAKTPGFWNTIRALMSHFQMFYVPSFDGIGRFERADKKLEKPTATVEVSLSGISVADGSPRILQPGGVVMMGSAAPAERVETEASALTPRVVAYAPDPLLRGFIQQEPIPFWLMREGGIPILGSEVDTRSGDTTKVDLSLAARRVRRKAGLAYKQEVDTVSEGIMTELCSLMFQEIQLAHATAGLTLPLDFSLNQHIGKRVTLRIRGADGGEFTAFVSGITHSVDLRAGKELNSSTQVRLSHAKFFT